jgi:hypothetical protein
LDSIRLNPASEWEGRRAIPPLRIPYKKEHNKKGWGIGKTKNKTKHNNKQTQNKQHKEHNKNNKHKKHTKTTKINIPKLMPRGRYVLDEILFDVTTKQNLLKFFGTMAQSL